MNKDELKKLNTPELLAPAADLTTGLAALSNGADAVYAGLKRFNARERSENFTRSEMARLIEFAVERGKKVYVTVNTLLKEAELPEVATILADLSLLRPQGIIVQDLAVIKMLRDHLPELPIHASTQMGTHNSAGLEMLADWGVRRVILERQLSLHEVKQITRTSPIATEVFIHGALCCSLSGMCLLSSWMGGWSGNRGKCKQPCRRRYHADSGNGFFFSPKDLYTLDMITDLCDAGVASLKIEGRLKPARYVADVVRAYRLMLDTPPSERPHRLKEARRILAGALGRKWSHGFYDDSAGPGVIQYDSLGGAGKLVGKILGTRSGGVVVESSNLIRRGDRLRVQPPSGEEGVAFTVHRITQNNKPCGRLAGGEKGFITFDGELPQKGLIYKTGYVSDEQMPWMNDKKAVVKLRINIAVQLCEKEIACRVTTPLFTADWQRPCALQPARERPLTTANVTAEFSKMPPPGIALHEVAARIDGEFFMPFKELRELRREFWQWARCNVLPWVDMVNESPVTKCLLAECAAGVANPAAGLETPEVVVAGIPGDDLLKRKPIIAKPIGEIVDAAEEVILPDFCPEANLADLQSQVKHVYFQVGCRRFRVTSLYGLALLRRLPDPKLITAGFPLPVANSMAFRLLRENGVTKAMAWLELDQPALEKLAAKTGGCLEIMRSGHPPLLVTRAVIPVLGDITDSRGGEFHVVKEDTGIVRLYSGQSLTLPAVAEIVNEYYALKPPFNGVSASGETSSFNYYRAWC